MMIVGTAIVVAHNSAASIGRCLQALRSEAGWERILVDNASRDNTVELAQSVDPAARLIENGENRGFAAAANQGALLASGRILLFLNPDTIAHPGALTALSSTLQAKEVGAVGGVLLRENGEVDRGFSVRRFPTTASVAAEILLLNRFWPSNPLNRHYRCLDLDYGKSQEVDQPAGACLAVKREAWASVGGFDENFFPVWFEDVDFCSRLRSRHWKIIYSPDAVFAHSGGHSVSQLSIGDRQVFWYRNLLRYWRKHKTLAAVAGLRAIIAMGMGLRSFATILGLGPDNGGIGEALRAYARVIQQCVLKGPDTYGSENQ